MILYLWNWINWLEIKLKLQGNELFQILQNIKTFYRLQTILKIENQIQST